MPKDGLLLIVDDDQLVIEALYQTFIDDYDIIKAESGEDAIVQLNEHTDIDAVILDIKMATMDGLQTASMIKKINSNIPIIFHTGYPGEYSEKEIEITYQPFDYVGKNERPARLIRAVKNAVAFYQLQSSDKRLIALARDEYKMVGKSRKMISVYQKIEKIAPTDNKVMILGPTGTGKELVANAIHHRSPRADKPMVFFNCNHKSPDLVESELFGHLKGSFTGASDDRIGVFEYADGGTVFLDEIGDLDIRTQAKILRVIESGQMSRIGSSAGLHVDVRLICATNHDIESMVEKKLFRQDLYFRLKGITIQLPALKERREDIPYLIDYFIEQYCEKNGLGSKIFDSGARDYLIEFDWPGNVRQLLDTVQSLIVLSPSYYISKEDVLAFLEIQEERTISADSSYSELVKEYKRTLIIKKLEKNQYNIAATARDLKIDPANLRKLLIDLNLHDR